MATAAIDAHNYRRNQKCQYNGASVRHGQLSVRETQPPSTPPPSQEHPPYPDLHTQWDYNQNGMLRPDTFVERSTQMGPSETSFTDSPMFLQAFVWGDPPTTLPPTHNPPNPPGGTRHVSIIKEIKIKIKIEPLTQNDLRNTRSTHKQTRELHTATLM